MLSLTQHTLCPFSRIIRFIMCEKKIDFEIEEVEFWKQPNSLFKKNPAGTIPVLTVQLHNALEIQALSYQSTTTYNIIGHMPILIYLEETYKNVKLLAGSILDKVEHLRLIDWFTYKLYNEVTSFCVHERYIKYYAHKGAPQSSILKAARYNLDNHMKYMEFLLRNNKYIAGETFTAVDCAAAAHLSLLDFSNEVPWQRFPAVKDWYCIIKSRPAFRSLLNDKITGFSPSYQYNLLDF